MPLALQLFIEMAKIGLFAIGGGAVTIPFQQHLGEVTGWFSVVDLTNMLAIAQSLPGAVGINLAAYIGFWELSVGGAFIAVIGSILPSVIIILIIANLLDKFRENRFVDTAMKTIRPASLGLLICAVLLLFEMAFFYEGTDVAASFSNVIDSLAGFFQGISSEFPSIELQNFLDTINWKAILLFIVVIVLSNIKRLKRIHPFFWMLACGVIGVVFAF